jgi:ERCC4-type nuclease
MYFDLTKDEDEPELIDSSIDEIILLNDSLNNTKKRKHKVTPPSQSKKRSPLQQKEEEEEEDMIFLELDDEDEVDEEKEEEEDEVVILSPIRIPIQKQSIQRKVSSSAVISSSSMEKKRASISSSNIGLQLKDTALTSKAKTTLNSSSSSSKALLEGSSSSALTGSSAIIPVHTRASTSIAPTSWKWTCPDCLKEYAGATNDKRIEIRRAGVLGDCGAKKSISSLHSSSSSPASPPMFNTFSTFSRGIEDSHSCLADASNWEVILLLDSREVRTQKDRDYIPNGLMSREGVRCEKRSLPLGDITWIARRKADAQKPAKVPLHLIRASGRGGGRDGGGEDVGGRDGISRSHSGHQSTLDSDFGFGMRLQSSSSSSSNFLKSTSLSSLLPAKKASSKEKDDAKKAQKESEKKAKVLAASSAPRAEEEYMLDYIIERKSCNDLAASIIDGRYNEQKLRLANSGMRVTYLIEGDPHQTSLGGTGGPRAAFGGGPLKIGAKHILTAMANTQVLAGFHVVQTTTIDATIAHLGAMHRIVEANFFSSLECQRKSSIDEEGGGGGGGGGYTTNCFSSSSSSSSSSTPKFRSGTSGMLSPKGASQSLSSSTTSSSSSSHKICPNDCCTLMGRPTVLQRVITYASWSQLMKRPRHFTAMNLFGRALRQVNGCSAERAQAILERYPTPALLIRGYKNLKYPLRDGPTMLQGLPVRGQKACIGPALSRNVFDAFQGESQSRKKKSEVGEGEEGEDEDEEDEGKVVGEDETFG